MYYTLCVCVCVSVFVYGMCVICVLVVRRLNVAKKTQTARFIQPWKSCFPSLLYVRSQIHSFFITFFLLVNFSYLSPDK